MRYLLFWIFVTMKPPSPFSASSRTFAPTLICLSGGAAPDHCEMVPKPRKATFLDRLADIARIGVLPGSQHPILAVD
jgi:hypothetical protein